jgi:outer membrane receptor for ferrienterochelin and colicins
MPNTPPPNPRFAPAALALAAALACTAPASAQTPGSSQTVIIQSTQGPMRPGALRDEIVKTESISAAAIERAGATNLNEALDKNPGISVQLECSICNVRNVLLNNLPGRYTTLLIDGVPIFSSVSSAYGLDSVNVYGVERIDVARGAGASLIAPEALSGTVNVVTKRPLRSEARLRAQLGQYGSRQADAYGASAFSGGAITAFYSVNRHDSVDTDGNLVSEFTGFDRKLAGLGFFADDLGGFRLRGRLDVVDEKRGGGALGTDYAAIEASRSGNPFDWSRGAAASPDPSGWINPTDGTLVPYEDGRGGFSEIIFTKREQLIAVAERPLGETKLRLAFGAASHRQDSFYELAEYEAKQRQYYAEASLRFPAGGWAVTAGVNWRYEDLESRGRLPDGTPNDGIDNYVYRVPALFVQGYRALLDDRLELNGSLRLDKHNVFGSIASPRLNLLYHHTPRLASRLSLGTGFRAPTSFFEQDHGILDTIRIVREIDAPERSRNLSVAINHTDDRLAVTASYNFTRITNFAVLDPGQVDDEGNPITLFTSATEPVTVQGVDVNASWLLTPSITVSAAAEAFRYRFPAGTLVFARPDWKAYFGLDHEGESFDFSAKLVITGPMDLRRFHDDGSGSQGRFNLDGTPKRDRSPSFATLDLRAEWHLTPAVDLYVGLDNALDYRQSDRDSLLFVDAEGAPDVVHLWGPNRGRKWYAGVKFQF